MTNEERHIAVLDRMLESMYVYDSIQPTTERKKAIKMAIQALSQEPCRYWQNGKCNGNTEVCDDAISRQAVLDKAVYTETEEGWSGRTVDVKDIEALPPVTPQQKYGKWILLDECANSGYYCSNCQKKLVKEGWSNTVKKIKYCPNCGCRMVEPQESEG